MPAEIVQFEMGLLVIALGSIAYGLYDLFFNPEL